MDTLPKLRPRTAVAAFCPPPAWQRARGFTLIEMMVVVIISGILAATAVPMLDTYMARSAMSTHISALAGTLRLARAEAIKRNAPVTICPSKNAAAAEPDCMKPADPDKGWATGWVVFTDFNTDGVVDDDETVLAMQDAITNSGGIIPDPESYTVTFLPTGLAVGAAASFTIIPQGQEDNTKAHRAMCISMQGVSRLSKTSKC